MGEMPKPAPEPATDQREVWGKRELQVLIRKNLKKIENKMLNNWVIKLLVQVIYEKVLVDMG